MKNKIERRIFEEDRTQRTKSAAMGVRINRTTCYLIEHHYLYLKALAVTNGKTPGEVLASLLIREIARLNVSQTEEKQREQQSLTLHNPAEVKVP